MNRKVSGILTSVILCVFVFSQKALSWNDDVTHTDLSRYASENSVLSKDKGDYLNNIGLAKGLGEFLQWGADRKEVKEWIAKGAELEDAGTDMQGVLGTARYINHFHNPLQPWLDAGLSGAYNGESALLWSQDGGKQTFSVGGDWSWLTLRHFYYLALTSTTNADRQAYYAQTFRSLGQQIHLIQDMSQPAHIRNLEVHHAI